MLITQAFFILFVQLICSADHSKYRTCEQSKFCTRDRFISDQKWTINQKSVKVNKNTFEAQIYDEIYNTNLNLKIFYLDCGAARIRIEPSKKESFNRFDASLEPSIITQQELNSLIEINLVKDQEKCILKPANSKKGQNIEITYSPFSLFVLDTNGEKKRIVINSNNTAVFETNRDQKKHPELFESSSFGGHDDKFKNGPTSVSLDFDFIPSDVRLSGLPSHTLPLSLQNTVGVTDPIRLFNTDINTFEHNSVMAMYGAIPFVFSHSSDGFDGLFWCNPSETWADISDIPNESGKRLRLMSEGGYIDIFVMAGCKTPSEVSDFYTRITGRPQLVPYFGLAFHQCRWGYLTDNEVIEVDAKLDESLTPHDVLWLDLDHTDDRKYFTFHPTNFKDSSKLLHVLDKNKRQLVVLNDPHLRAEDSYKIYSEAKSKKLLIRNSDGNGDFIGNCWPGKSAWPDFLIPEAREWWASNFLYTKFTQSKPNLYIWNDMNEIAVFDSVDLTAPRDLVHYGNIEEREVHNIYGLLMVSATFNGLIQRNNDKNQRPFILTRSFFSGSQKFSVMWTGDNTGNWEHLRGSLQMVLCDGLTGMVYSGADVGGFFESPDQKLLSRWYNIAAWTYPFFRVHCHHLSNRREIYSLTEEKYFNLAHDGILERYQHLPLWYTLAHESNTTGAPIVRPIWWHFSDESYRDVDDKVLLGNSLLVVPFVNENEEDITIQLPQKYRGDNAKTIWYGLRQLNVIEPDNNGNTVVHFQNEGQTEVFIRGGSIIPIKPRIRKSSPLMFWDPFRLTVAVDSQGKAEGELYVDDGQTFDFVKSHQFVHKKFVFESDQTKATLRSINASQFDNQSPFVTQYDVIIEEIKIAGLQQTPKSIVDSHQTDKTIGFDVDKTNNALIIHMPQLLVRDDFELILNF